MPHRTTTPAERSARIKRGIQRAKLAGVAVGANGRRLGALHHADATERALRCWEIVVEFRQSGATYRGMVDTLNRRREPTPTGTGRWHVKTIQRLVERVRDADPLLRRSALALAEARKRRIVLQASMQRARELGAASIETVRAVLAQARPVGKVDPAR